MAGVIHRYAVNVPYWDEWDMLTVVPKAYDGTLDWASIWQQQLEHRSVTAKLVSLLLAKTTRLNLVDEMYLGFAFEFLSFLLIWNMLSTDLKDRLRPLIWPLTFVASLLLFWPVTYEIWTWGIASFQYFSSAFWAVLTVWALTRWPGRWLGVAIAAISTTVAIYTTGHGFALIPVGILGMLVYGMAGRRVPWMQLCVFALVGLACTSLYRSGYIAPAHPPGPLSRVTPVHMGRYFLTYIGAPFWTTRAQLSIYFGVLGLGVLSVSVYYIIRSMRDWIKITMPWLLLAGYTLVNAVITAFARTRFGVNQAGSSRYSAIVILFWISIITISSIIAVNVSPRFNRATVTAGLTALIILFGCGYSYLYYKGIRGIRLRNELFVYGLPYVMKYDKSPDEKLQIFHPFAIRVRELSQKMEQYGLGPFAHRPTPTVD